MGFQLEAAIPGAVQPVHTEHSAPQQQDGRTGRHPRPQGRDEQPVQRHREDRVHQHGLRFQAEGIT